MRYARTASPRTRCTILSENMFSEPVVGEKFFGRGDVLELLNKRALALKDGYRQNVALTGQSLVGKSSIIHHFLRSIQEEGFIPIYVEVVKEHFKSFANKFIATMLYNALLKSGEQPAVELDKLLEKAARVFPKTHASIRHINAAIDKGDIDEAYSDLLGLTSILKDEVKMPCIVILDEFDNLEQIGVRNPFLNFGKVIMVQKDTMYIVSSSRNQAIKKILSEKLSLLFGNFEIVKISSFDTATANEYISMKSAGFEMADDVRKFLISFTGGNPFYLDKLVTRSRDMALERLSNFIGAERIAEAILELVYNSTGVIHQYLLNFMLDLLDTRYKERYISILISIANGQKKQAEIARNIRTKQGEVSTALIRLQELGLISKNGVAYGIDDCIFGFWLKFVYQRRKNLLVDGILNRSAIFRDDIISYVGNCIAESEHDVASRITELFNLFSNELVQIDSKQMRLPRFTKVEPKVFQDSKAFIAASFRGNTWVIQPYEEEVSENDIIVYIRNTKALGYKISNKVIIPLKGIDENARLLAKELKLSIWDISFINILLGLYDKRRIITF